MAYRLSMPPFLHEALQSGLDNCDIKSARRHKGDLSRVLSITMAITYSVKDALPVAPSDAAPIPSSQLAWKIETAGMGINVACVA